MPSISSIERNVLQIEGESTTRASLSVKDALQTSVYEFTINDGYYKLNDGYSVNFNNSYDSVQHNLMIVPNCRKK